MRCILRVLGGSPHFLAQISQAISFCFNAISTLPSPIVIDTMNMNTASTWGGANGLGMWGTGSGKGGFDLLVQCKVCVCVCVLGWVWSVVSHDQSKIAWLLRRLFILSDVALVGVVIT